MQPPIRAWLDVTHTPLATRYEAEPSLGEESLVVFILCCYLLALTSMLFFASWNMPVPEAGTDPSVVSRGNSNSPQTYVFVEGNIGAGKSTFIQALCVAAGRRADRLCLLEWKEPIDDWSTLKVDDERSLFSAFYANKGKYAFSLQVYILLTRISQYIRFLTMVPVRSGAGNIVIVERSLATCLLFSGILLECGHMDVLSHQILSAAVESIPMPPKSLCIYIRTDVEVAKGRIQKRARKGEEDFDAEYLERLHRAHESTVALTADLTLNGCLDESGLGECCEKVLDYIENYHKDKL